MKPASFGSQAVSSAVFVSKHKPLLNGKGEHVYCA